MKKILLLTLSLLMVVTLLAACKDEPEVPADTDTEAVTEAPAVTEPETEMPTEAPTETPTEAPTEVPTEPVTEPSDALDADELWESVMEKNQLDILAEYHLLTDLTLDISATLNGMTTNMAMTGGISLIQQENQGIALELTIPTQEPYSLVYADGMLYMTSAEGKYRCPMEEVEMALVWSELMGDLFPSEGAPEDDTAQDGGLTDGLTGLLSTMKLSALFAKCEISTDEATGDTTLLLEGISRQTQFLINMMFSSMDGIESDQISDMDMSLLLDMLATFDMDALAVELTVDKDHLLKSSTLTMAMDMTNAPDLVGDIPMTLTLTAATTLDRGAQTVTPPTDADTYEETDWRTLFGLYTAEMLGLVPDEQGVVTLSEEPDTYALQYDYMMKHIGDFEGVTLSVTARVSDFIRNEDGTVEGIIYQVYGDGTPAYYPYLYVLIPADVAEGMELPVDESIAKLTATLVIVEDGETYYDLTVTDYQLVSGPTAVG